MNQQNKDIYVSPSSQYALFLDIDGTLVHDSPTPPPPNSESIRLAQEAGHLVFLCTGRSLACIQPEILAANQYDGIVAGTGSYVQLGDRVLLSKRLSQQALRRIAAYYLQTNVLCIFEGETAMYMVQQAPNARPDWQQVTSPDDFDTRFAGADVNKLSIAGQLPPEAVQMLDEEGMFVIQHLDYAEAMPKGCSKSEGMKIILAETGIHRQHTIAIGDSLNDVDMLAYAGLGVAMGNAPDQIKAMADVVTGTSGEAGVAMAIRTYLL